MEKLTPKQLAFAEKYIETGNASEAARSAGYKDYKSLNVQGSKLLKTPKIAAYIAERLRPTQDKAIATADEVMEFYTRVMKGEEKDQFGLEASLSDRLKAGENLMKRLAVQDASKASGGVTVVIDV